MVATLHAEPGARPGVDNLILVSSDTHIGPLMSQLRDYCPQQYLDDFDAFGAQMQAQGDPTGAGELREAMAHLSLEEKEALLAQFDDPNGPVAQYMRNRRTPGHHDMNVRLDDMDRDGLACEIIFHGSQNGEPIPFVVPHDLPAGLTTPFSFEGLDLELAYAGIHMYNQWLADQVSIQPERHVGLAYIPAWDPELTVEEVIWARDAGLKGVNMPAWRPGMPILQDDAWEPFYATCNELTMPLTNHGGAGDDRVWPVAEATALRSMESAYHSKRLIWSLAFHGVFDRYPDLNLMISEIPGEWWAFLMREMDTSPGSPGRGGFTIPGRRAPSDVCATNVFHGATFMSRSEAEDAVDENYWANIVWGSDYPHTEGTWQFPETDGEEPQTHLALRDSFAGIDEHKVRAMVGLNGIRAYDLDHEKLQAVANRICAPSWDEVDTPLDAGDVPANHGMFAFRTRGPWA